MSIYGLQNIAKEINLIAYKKWLCDWSEYLSIPIIEKGENDVAQFIAPAFIQNLVYSNGEWWSFNKMTSLWKQTKDPSATITTFIQQKLNEGEEMMLSIANALDLDDEGMMAIKKNKAIYKDTYKTVSHSGSLSVITKYFKTYLCDDGFTENLDNGLYKMVFRNGVYDLKTGLFRKGIKQNDYISKTIPCDYEKPKQDETDYVWGKLLQICNNNVKHLEFYLSCLGYAFTGDSSKEQLFWYFRGQTADNGKSVIFEALENMMPNYVMKANSDVLDKGADLRKEVATWRGLKLLWLNEVSTKMKDAELVKAICDGTSYKYNKLYAIEAVVMPIRFKLFAVSNNSLKIKGDGGVKRRFVLGQFNSQFKDTFKEDNYERLQFKKDKNLRNNLETTYKNALIHLIMSYGTQYWNDKKLKEYPKEWAKGADEDMADNDTFREFFKENFVVDKVAMIHKTSVEEKLKEYEYHKYIKFKDELARLGISYKYDSQKIITNAHRYRLEVAGFWCHK
jgi:hypothetical protein